MTEIDDISATRAAYDATADAYAELVGTELTSAVEAPFDRALLATFVEYVRTAAAGRVADVGCGTGRVAAFLAANGFEVVGFDVSPAMLDIARVAHPGIEFSEGQLTNLPVPDGTFAGIACWYSIINTPPARLDLVCVELGRVLAPGGVVVLAFQAGNGEAIHHTVAYGRPVTLTSYRHAPGEVADRLADAGLAVHVTATRQPEFAHESTPNAFVIARHER